MNKLIAFLANRGEREKPASSASFICVRNVTKSPKIIGGKKKEYLYLDSDQKRLNNISLQGNDSIKTNLQSIDVGMGIEISFSN